MTWVVRFHDELEAEFSDLSKDVQDAFLTITKLLKDYGPQLGRPYVDTLKGSKYANMKELRFDADDGVWRVAFAFDPRRHAILLVSGDKSGGSEGRFYRKLIARAEKRYAAHLESLKDRRIRKGR